MVKAPHVVLQVQREQLPGTVGHFPDDTAHASGPADPTAAELHVRGRRRVAGLLRPVPADRRPLHADGRPAAEGQVGGRHQVAGSARVRPRPDQPVHVAHDGRRGRRGRGGRAPRVVRRAHHHVVVRRLRLRRRRRRRYGYGSGSLSVAAVKERRSCSLFPSSGSAADKRFFSSSSSTNTPPAPCLCDVPFGQPSSSWASAKRDFLMTPSTSLGGGSGFGGGGGIAGGRRTSCGMDHLCPTSITLKDRRPSFNNVIAQVTAERRPSSSMLRISNV
ncbi:hypothetical protein AGLY_016283 [Aphis glycines]|uniref:Uncharacterized protein n=1 Tax=Aphis glycines TaxID=307491 RepID=A0A6G0SZ13_APHGL|nr:hypothetical protein AGLY_016283 [Aphis glycines]